MNIPETLKMERRMLGVQDRVCLSVNDLTELVAMFKEFSHPEHALFKLTYAYDSFLCAAVECDQRDLIAQILAHKYYVNDDQLALTLVKPLLVAMNTGNLHLMEVFLRAGASMRLECFGPIVSFSNPDVSYTFMSAIEFACVLNDPEVFKVLVSHDNERHQERYVIIE